MVHILLTVLAVIGKILLGILGFILLLLLLILLAPFCYRVTAKKQEKDLKAEASVSWLLRLVYFKLTFKDKKLSYELRLFGIPVFKVLGWLKSRKSSGKAKKKKQDRKDPEVTRSETVEPAIDVVSEETSGETSGEVFREAELPATNEPLLSVDRKEEKAESIPEAVPATDDAEVPEGTVGAGDIVESEVIPDSEAAAEPEKAGAVEKIGTVLKKIGSVLKKIFGIPGTVIKKIQALLDKLKAVKGKVNNLRNKAEEGVELLKSDMFKAVFALVKKEVIAIVRHILPRKFWGWIEFGAPDPGTTGEILAVAGMLYPVMPRKLALYPDFEKAVLNMDLSLKGHIQLIVPVFRGVKIILNKNVRRLIKKIRHKGA